MRSDITPFAIDVPQTELDDLAERLRRTRWAYAETVDDWSQGIPLSYTQELCGYWADAYDWRAREAALNRFPQFRTEIDGHDVHFIHVRSAEPGAMPLILTHGWPGSVSEFLKILADAVVESVKIPPRSPNLNAHAERFVRTIKESCLERLILFGEDSIRKTTAEFVCHYHRERNHQGLENLIHPEADHLGATGEIQQWQRLGGLLNYYYSNPA